MATWTNESENAATFTNVNKSSDPTYTNIRVVGRVGYGRSQYEISTYDEATIAWTNINKN